jgi:soluble lytic murein transglycosylase
MRLVALAAVVAGIVVAAVLIGTGRTVVPVVSEQIYRIHYRDGIARVAERYDLDPYLVAAVVQIESGYDPEAVSPAGAVGLMQLMPETADWVTGLDSWQGDDAPDLTDPADNLELGACYLGYLTETLGGRATPALAAYNAGPSVAGRWIEAAGGEDSFDLTDIPYPETRTFVERVEHYRELYSRVYPDAFADAGNSYAAGGSPAVRRPGTTGGLT